METEIQKIVCPCCGNPDCEEDDDFCFNCGKLLKNFCSNDLCSMNNGDAVELPGDFCYCPHCGEETTFMKDGYIKPQTFSQAD